jgi:hypothetical protein
MAKKIERSAMTQTDSKGNVIREPRDNATGEAINFRWWTLDEEEMAPAIAATVRFIQRHQGTRIEQLTVSTRLYGNTSVYNLMGTAFTRASSVNSNPMSQRISYNICESVIDTLESRVAKNQVIPTFITNGGDWNVQKKAKQLTKFVHGLFYKENVHPKSIYAWKDGAIWGDGFVQVYEKDDKVCVERAFSHELFVDTIESLTGDPKQLHRVKIMDRDIALELLPELEEYIKTVSPANYQDIGGQGTAVDLITVIESWHLKSGPNAKDGLHVFSIGDGAYAEEYEKDYFPFPHLRYVRRPFGWYGQGVCERLQNIQGEINRSMILKQRALWMQGAFKVLLENGSKIVSQHLNNDVGSIIHYTGTPPQYVTPPATNPELQQWIDALMTYGYNQEGISRMSTTGETPLGVESGKAMRTLVQINDDRFAFMMQEQENFVLEIARQGVDVVKDIYKRKGKYEVIFPDTRFLETIDWSDIKLDQEEYVLKAFPTSSLSDDISGRLSEIQELAQAGMVSPRTARRLLDMPDVEVNDALANAAEDRLHQIFERMLDDGKFTRFQPGFHDAQLAQQLALEYVNYAEYMGAPEDNIQLIRDYLAQVNSEALTPNPGVVPQQQLPSPQPQANPMATPQSNLIPNVPGVA